MLKAYQQHNDGTEQSLICFLFFEIRPKKFVSEEKEFFHVFSIQIQSKDLTDKLKSERKLGRKSPEVPKERPVSKDAHTHIYLLT